MKNVQKSIGIEEILNDITFTIEDKEKVALVGINGAGKTSVFRLLTGEWEADEGAITKVNGMRLGYLPQLSEEESFPSSKDESKKTATPFSEGSVAGVSPAEWRGLGQSPIVNEETLFEVLDKVFEPLKKIESELRNLEQKMSDKSLSEDELDLIMKKYDQLSLRFQESGGYEMNSRLKGVLRGLGFIEEQWIQPYSKLSGGEKTRALLGKLLLERAELLLLDEPTNHLDIDSVAWLEEYLKSFSGAVLIISHDRYFMDRVVTKTIEIEHKKSVVYNGNYSYFVEKKAKDRLLAEKHFVEQQKVIKHHEEVIKTFRSWKTEKAMIRAKSREKLLDKIERVEKPAEDPNTMRLRLNPKIKSGNDVLDVEGLTMGFGGKTLFEDVSFELKKGDKVALIGPNGIGKTTLLKILVGELQQISGRVREGVNVRLGYYDQAHSFALESEEKSIFQELADTYPRLPQTEIRTLLAAFMFIGDDVFKPISALSGGERGRVQLAKIMLAGANFLILDEPTNHLDLFSKEILEEALRDFTGTLLYISHDRYFINNTATRVLDLTPTGIVAYAGNYDYYVEKKALLTLEGFITPPVNESINSTTSTNQTNSPTDSKKEWLRKKEQDANERKKNARISKLETEIAMVESRISECETDLADDEIGRDAERAQVIFEEKTTLEEKLLLLYDEWGQLN